MNDISTSKIVIVIAGLIVVALIIAGCSIATAAFQPNVQPMPYHGEIDD